ncbi:MAG: AI-2E family transporter [Acidimicrobiales bacterium]|nr:AI-2E family transporter [Acidimicrobiales bacterium]
MAATRGTVEHRVVQLSARAAVTIVLLIVGLIIGGRMFVAAHRPLSWAAATAIIAILIDPIVDRLALHIRRVPAVLLTFVMLGAAAVGTTYFVFDEVQQALDRLEVAAPEAAAAVEDRTDRIGELARDFKLDDRIVSFTNAVNERATGGDDVLRTTAGTAPTYLVCAVLTVFLLTYGPRIAKGALEQVPDEDRRAHIADVVGPAVAKARTAVLLTTATAIVWGGVVSVLASALDVPAPTAVGFGAGIIALLPHVGIAVGSLPLLILTLGFRSTTAALLVGAVVIAAQALDSIVVRRWIAARSLEVGLLVPFIVGLIGYEVYGIGGAAYSLVVAVGGLAMLDRLHEVNQQREVAAQAAAAKARRKRAPRPRKKAAPAGG